jgi:hypothetical protein
MYRWNKEKQMPLYMDVHHKLPAGATAGDVAEAHMADLRVQENFGVNYINYWLAETEGKVYCLVQAPDAESAIACHREAHGLTPDEIHEVVQG